MPSILAILCAVAILVTQFFYGGLYRPILALPGFFLVGLAGVLALVVFRRRGESLPTLVGVALVSAVAGWLMWRESAATDAWLAAGFLRLTLGCFVVYLLFASVIVVPHDRLWFVSFLLGACVVQSAVGFWQVSGGPEGFPVDWLSEQLRSWYSDRYRGRAHGFYLNGNHLTWLLNTGCFLGLALGCWGRMGWSARIGVLACAFVALVGSLSAASRGGLLSLGAGLALLALLSLAGLVALSRKRALVTFVGLALVAGLAALVGQLVFANNQVLQSRLDLGLSDIYRQSVFQAGLRQLQEAPLLGGGPGAFLYAGRELRTLIENTDDVFAHNDWLQVAGDFGLPAFVLILLAAVWHFGTGLGTSFWILRTRLSGARQWQSNALALQLGSLAAVAGFAVHSWVDFNMQVPANALLASACMGMLANGGVARSAEAGRVWGRRTVIVSVAASGLFLAIMSFRAAPAESAWLSAENAAQRGDWIQTLAVAREGLLADPQHPKLLRLDGESLLAAAEKSPPDERLPVYQAADQAFRQAARLQPGDSALQFLLADTSRRLGQRRLARSAAIQGIVLDPLRAVGYEMYGEILLRENRPAEARRSYLLSTSVSGSDSWYIRRPVIEELIRRKNSDSHR